LVPSILGFVPPGPCQWAINRIKISLYLIEATPMDTEPLAFPALTTMLKAAGEATRLRILALIAAAELTVSGLPDVLPQSKPRWSRHLRLLAEASLVDRFREASWAFFRLRERGSAADI